MIIGVSGAAGRMGRLVAAAIDDAEDLELGPLFDPGGVGDVVSGRAVDGDPGALEKADVVVEFTRPDVVMDNLAEWRRMGLHAVVGTSGFDAGRLEALRTMWGAGPPNCLVVPNFSIGAVMMMHLSGKAAPYFEAAEIVELHHDGKVDAPSGTATATAERIGEANPGRRAVEGTETAPGARGAKIGGVPVHAIRLPGLVAHQEVLFGSTGETLTIRHDTTDRTAFMPGVLAAVRSVPGLDRGVTVGLEEILGLT